MTSTLNPKIEKDGDEEEKKKKAKKKPELFPPLKKKPEVPSISVQIENSCVFPKVGMIGNNEQITFIGHSKPVVKIIFVKTSFFPNHLCTLSIDGKIKLWKLNDNASQKCIKSIDVCFEAWDILMGNSNNIVVCGEEIAMINLENEEKIIIQEKKFYKYVDYNLLARINNEIGVCTSLNDYYYVFDLNKGNIIKKIEFDKTHFICQMEKNQKIKKKIFKKRKKNKEEKEDNLNEGEEEEEEKEDIEEKNIENNKVNENKNNEIKNEIQKMIRDLGSGKCKEYEKGHKGHVHALLGINTEKFKNSIISGAEDNLIKIINIDNPREVIDLSGHNNTIESLILDNSKQYLFSGSLDYTIKKWDLNMQQCLETMGFNNAFQILLLHIDNNYLLSVGVNSQVKLWNENCLNVKTYKYSHGYIKSGLVISYDKDYNKVKFVFGDNKGDIFIKIFIIGQENINKYNEYMIKKQKEAEEKASKRTGSLRKSMPKLSFKNEDFDKNYHFKESTYETQNTEN